MHHSKLAKRGWLLLVAATAFVYLCQLGVMPLVGADEPRYVQVAREMFLRGDWVTPTLGGRRWFEKPALVYWTEIASFKLFGVAEWTARLGVALSGWLTALLVGWLARRIEREAGPELRGLGLAAAGALASSLGLLVFSRAVNFDVMVMMTLTLALACFLLADLTVDERLRRWLLAGFYGGMGLSLLAKGLIGVVLPVGIIALYYLLRRSRPQLMKLMPWGVLLTLAVAATWYAPVMWRHGWTFIDEFIIQHHFARYTSNKYLHPQPIYFYVPIMLLLVLPWTAYLIAALWRARRWDWRETDSGVMKFRLFALAWIVAVIGFFSLSGSKLPGYILPALPGAALLAGDELARYVRGESSARAMRATGALILALAFAGLGYVFYTREVGKLCALLSVAPYIAAGLLALFVARERRLLCVVSCVGASLLTVALIGNCAAEGVARRESVRELLRLADVRGYASAPVVNLHTIERTAEFYAAGRLIYADTGQPVKSEGVAEVIAVAEKSGGTALVIVPIEYQTQLTESPRLLTEIIGDNKSVALVGVRLR